MGKLTRRSFIRGTTAASIGMGLGLFPSIARAASPWGALPAGFNLPKYRVLDIVMPGGASQWENFWVSHDGPGGSLNWRGLGDYVEDLTWIPGANTPSSLETRVFANDFLGDPAVSWGPATKPLWRPDIFERTRMLVTQHTHKVHSLSLFLNLTGRNFGRPRAACVGAPVQRHFRSLGEPMNIPYSYVFAPSHLGKPYVKTYATAIGQHPGSSRPLALKVGEPIGALLTRNGVSAEADAVFGILRNQYRDLLRFDSSDNPVRSKGFEAYDGAAQYLVNAQALNGPLGGDALQDELDLPSATDHTPEHELVPNPTKRSLELAATMFAHGARHITVIDGGLNISTLRDSSFPYDGHHRANKNVVEMTSAHLFNLLDSLAGVIDESSGTGIQVGTGPGFKIDLNTTLVRVFTEFGRHPSPGASVADGGYRSCGREHFPNANVMLLIGGPVQSRGVQGYIDLQDGDPETAVAYDALTATDTYAAMLMAAGVDPFASDNLTTGDDFSDVITSGGASQDQIRARLKEKVLGVSTQIDSILS